MDFRGMATTHMGNHPTLKLIQIMAPVQRGRNGHSKIHDDMEAGLSGVQGFTEEDGMEYGGYSYNES